MNGFMQDVRYTLRQLIKNPGFVIVAVLTLALGIAANTTIFSVMNATILRPLSFANPDRLVLVWETFGKNHDLNVVSAPNYWDIARRNHSFENAAIFDFSGRGYNLGAKGENHEPEQASGMRVSSTFFSVLGVQPFLGRNFLPEEEVKGRDRAVILSYGLWKRRYGADRSLIGHPIRIDGENYTVIGVMPKEFRWQFWSGQRQLWVPVGYTETDQSRGFNSFIALARLKHGVNVDQARADMKAIGAQLSREYPDTMTNMSATAIPMGDFGLSGIKATMSALLAAVGFVLLIACVNVANLLLARGAARQRELAMRRTLGASGIRIARQLLTESLVLSFLGGLGGLALAAWSVGIMPAILPDRVLHLPLRDLETIPLDGRVLGFALLISCLTGILFGLVPAINSIRGSLNATLRKGERGAAARGRIRHLLVASEVALALVVLSGAGLMIQSMSRLLGVDPGFNPANVLTMKLSQPQENLLNGMPSHPRFCRSMDEHVGAISGIAAVGAVAHLPLEGNTTRSFAIEGRPNSDPANRLVANYNVACPGYFRALEVPLLAGREFNHDDNETAQGVVVINQSMAQKYWPGENPVGRAIRMKDASGTRMVVVGVVGDTHHWGLDAGPRPQFFRPYAQAGLPVMSIVARTLQNPASYAIAVKKALAEIEPDKPVSDIKTMREIVEDSLGSRRFPTLLLGSFAGVALVLAAVGIVGVVSYSVTQRTQEIGVRMALGARTTDVLRLIVQGNMKWVLVGIAFGIVGSLGLTRLLGNLLYDVKPSNPFVLATVSLLLASVALLASYLPARRAAKVDPMVALRYE